MSSKRVERAARAETVIEFECHSSYRGFVVGLVVGLLVVTLTHLDNVAPALERAVAHTPARLTPIVTHESASPEVAPPSAAAKPERKAGDIPSTSWQGEAASGDSCHGMCRGDGKGVAEVAVCVGGSLSFAIPGNGVSVRRALFEPLRSPDVFVAGTLTEAGLPLPGRPWRARTKAALLSISQLAPFTAADVRLQPTSEELRLAVSSSGFWEQYARQASKGGDGRLNPADEDPRLWLPTMVAPVLGNPSAHTLREFHYQSRCFGLMQRHETKLREKSTPRRPPQLTPRRAPPNPTSIALPPRCYLRVIPCLSHEPTPPHHPSTHPPVAWRYLPQLPPCALHTAGIRVAPAAPAAFAARRRRDLGPSGRRQRRDQRPALAELAHSGRGDAAPLGLHTGRHGPRRRPWQHRPLSGDTEGADEPRDNIRFPRRSSCTPGDCVAWPPPCNHHVVAM